MKSPMHFEVRFENDLLAQYFSLIFAIKQKIHGKTNSIIAFAGINIFSEILSSSVLVRPVYKTNAAHAKKYGKTKSFVSVL